MTDMDAWVDEARSVDIGSVAAFLNLQLKGRGEMVGPCPRCGGTDRFAVNTKRGCWNCRGCAKGGDAIGLAQHVLGCDFIAACEAITGRPSPRGGGKKLSPAEREAIDREIAGRNAERERKEAEDRKRRADTAAAIWGASQRLFGAPADYLKSRGLDPKFADGQLRTHPNLKHPDGGNYPALIGRVAALDGSGCGVWRIFVKADGSGKAPVENAKLGLGNTAGGSVRIGGIASEIGIAEGIETALACRQMIFADTGRMVPVWAALSTSGMRAVELPPEIQSVRIYADADAEKLLRGDPKPSPGLEAAKTLAERLKADGRQARISIPSFGNDWLSDMQATEAA